MEQENEVTSEVTSEATPAASPYEQLLALLKPSEGVRERTPNATTRVPGHTFTVERALQMLRRTRRLDEKMAYGLPEQFIFYAHVMGSLERVHTDAIDTFAIGPYKNRYALYINPHLGAMPLGELIASMEHEVCHVVFSHAARRITTRSQYAGLRERYLHALCDGLAADAAINDILCQTYPEMLDPARPFGYWVLPEDMTPPLPRNGTYEGYLHTMIQSGLAKIENPEKLYELALRVLRVKYAETIAEHTAAAASTP